CCKFGNLRVRNAEVRGSTPLCSTICFQALTLVRAFSFGQNSTFLSAIISKVIFDAKPATPLFSIESLTQPVAKSFWVFAEFSLYFFQLNPLPVFRLFCLRLWTAVILTEKNVIVFVFDQVIVQLGA